jgi:SAM-dependent methyltransferase
VTDAVRDAYDARAADYTAFVVGALDRVPGDKESLAVFAERVDRDGGVVADLGCGPGYVVDHLRGLGVQAVGYDISGALIAEARRAVPDADFHVGDLGALDLADASLGGIVARYSLIHTLPSMLGGIFDEWMRALEPGAPVLVSFFASSSPEAHGTPFDHAVVTAYELCPASVARQLGDAGFIDIDVIVREPRDGERPLQHATIHAAKSVGPA